MKIAISNNILIVNYQLSIINSPRPHSAFSGLVFLTVPLCRNSVAVQATVAALKPYSLERLDGLSLSYPLRPGPLTGIYGRVFQTGSSVPSPSVAFPYSCKTRLEYTFHVCRYSPQGFHPLLFIFQQVKELSPFILGLHQYQRFCIIRVWMGLGVHARRR